MSSEQGAAATQPPGLPVSSHDPPTLPAGEFAPMVMLLGTGVGDDEEEEEEEEEG